LGWFARQKSYLHKRSLHGLALGRSEERARLLWHGRKAGCAVTEFLAAIDNLINALKFAWRRLVREN
jgi:hypothetical protein